jgi:hypothetical protein
LLLSLLLLPLLLLLRFRSISCAALPRFCGGASTALHQPAARASVLLQLSSRVTDA